MNTMVNKLLNYVVDNSDKIICVDMTGAISRTFDALEAEILPELHMHVESIIFKVDELVISVALNKVSVTTIIEKNEFIVSMMTPNMHIRIVLRDNNNNW